MSLNQVYKKDADSDGGSISPGLSQEEDEEEGAQREDSSLIDLFIQNSRPDNRRSHQGGVGQEFRSGPSGPAFGLSQQDQLYFQPPTGENSVRQPGGRRNLGNSKPGHRASGSFTHASRERMQQDKKQKIDNFMERQNEYGKRKEHNLKKLTKQQVQKERTEPGAMMMGSVTPRGMSSIQGNQIFHGKKKSRNSSRGVTKSSKQINHLDSFEGVKDAVANKMHCDPHSTSSNLAMQSLRFPQPGLTTFEQQQYLTSMNTHPLLINTNPSGQLSIGQHQSTQFMLSPVVRQTSGPIPMQQMQSYSQFPAPFVGDYYKTATAMAAAPQMLPRPNSIGLSGAKPVGRPNALGTVPQQQIHQSQAFQAAIFQEEVLDEFPVPTNVHVAPKHTDMSMQQQSFLQMQNAINQSSRFDDLFNNQVLHNAHQLIAGNHDSQNVTGIMQALANGPQTNDLLIGQGPGMNVTPIRPMEPNAGISGSQSPNSRPAHFGPSGVSGRGYVSQSCIQPLHQLQQQQQIQMLDVTQVMQGSGSQLAQQNGIHKTNSISTLQLMQQQMSQGTGSKDTAAMSQHQLMMALNEQQLFIDGRNSSGAPCGQIAKDIDILDSEFAQEESRQIEAYYRSVNKESDDRGRKQRSTNARVKNALNQPVKKNKSRGGGGRVLSPPAQGYKQMNGRSTTERKMGGVKVGISRLDSTLRRQSSRDHDSNNQTVNRSQMSRDSQRSARQANVKAVALARKHLKKITDQKRQKEHKRTIDEKKKKAVEDQRKNTRDELYLSNKLTRQFIMVTSLVMQSEDLSEDSIFNYAQYTEFAIRFGLMSERAASEESDERALLYEMWCTLSRVHSDFAFIRVVNLKTMITAILGFPVALHRNPAHLQPKRSQQKAAAQQRLRKLQEKQMQRRSMDDQIIQEEGPQQESEDETDSDFREADDLANDVPLENNDLASRQKDRNRQPPINERSAGKSAYRESSQQSFDSSQPSQFNQQYQATQVQPFGQSLQKRPSSIIDEQDELRAAENGQLSSPEEGMKRDRRVDHHQGRWNEEPDAESDDEDEQYFFDNPDQQQKQEHQSDEGEGVESYGEEETTSQNEYAIDRAHNIGFFVHHYEFCMSLKDVRTVQRRFKLFQRNWREFQKKDLIVKKSVIVDDGATFQPSINKKSERLIRNKEQGNVEFPLSTRNDQKVQRRQRIWERELPRGVKSKERIHETGEFIEGDRNVWHSRTADHQLEGFNQQPHQTRQQSNVNGGEYFTMGADGKEMRTYASSFSRNSSQDKNSNSRGLTTPKLNQRMEHIYQIGRHKILNRQDLDKNSQDFEKQVEDCTFQPQISQISRQISMKRSFSKEDKPWTATAIVETAKTVKNSASQQQLAERMQLSIQKDIQRKRLALREKQIKSKVMAHGGWPKDYDEQRQQQEAAAKPVFKRYDAKPQQNKKIASGNFNQPKQLIQQRYPLTTNTSTSNLNQLSPPVQFAAHEDRRQTAQQLVPFSGAHGEQEQLGLCSDPVTPIKENASDTQRHERGQEFFAPRTMLHQHHANSEQSAAVIHERTPSRTRHGHMQSLETGGIQHSEHEQGRAPLDSQSSTCQNIQTTASASKNNDAGIGHFGHATVEDTNHGMTTNINTNASQAQLLQKAMEELTVIQETTLEQTQHNSLKLPGSHQSQGNMNSDFVSQSNISVQPPRKPLLYIEVDTNGSDEGGVERIEVFKGDDPRQLSIDFCRKHDYDEGTQIVLQRQIEEKLKRAYDKLQAKMEEKRQNRLAEKFRERQNLKQQRQ